MALDDEIPQMGNDIANDVPQEQTNWDITEQAFENLSDGDFDPTKSVTNAFLQGKNIGPMSGSWANRPGSGTRSGQNDSPWSGQLYYLDNVGVIRYDGSNWVVHNGEHTTFSSTTVALSVTDSFQSVNSFSSYTRINGGRLRIDYTLRVASNPDDYTQPEVRLRDTSNDSTFSGAVIHTFDSETTNDSETLSGFILGDVSNGGGTDTANLALQMKDPLDGDLVVADAYIDLYYVPDPNKSLG